MPLQQHVQLPAMQPNLLPTPPAITALPEIPLIIITLPLQPITPDGHKHSRLEAIPEEEELPEPEQKRFEDILPAVPEDAQPDSPQLLEVQVE